MKVLIIGNGGREHALAWKVAQSSIVEQVFVAPGNGGTASENKVLNIEIDVLAIDELIHFAKKHNVELTIVGPELPLAAGIVDAFALEGLAIFGPVKSAAQLESSKQFSKEFMVKNNIPTAFYKAFTDIDAAKEFVKKQKTPIVIKADGLAAGKGVIIAATETEAFIAIDDMLAGNKFGEAGHRIIIEEFLEGEEASFIVMCDGNRALPMVTSQDHKKRDDADKGPNTGGMGAYSPAPIVTDALHSKIMQTVIEPTIAAMKRNGSPYVGFLYAGIMIDKNNEIKVLEFNCRLGDPEAQVLLFRLESDLVTLCLSALAGQLETQDPTWNEKPALGIVLAAGGYPSNYQKGDVIQGLDNKNIDGIKTFHAGTKAINGSIVTNGGRVLCVCALGDNIQAAQKESYHAIQQIHFNGMFYRNDIGYRALS